MSKGFKSACPQCFAALQPLQPLDLPPMSCYLVCPHCGYREWREICKHCGHSKREGQQRCPKCSQ